MKSLPMVVTLAALAVTAAAESGIQGPVAGFIPDTKLHAIRPINGIPGASVLGPALPLPVPVRQAAVSSANDFAVVISEEDGRVHLVRGLASAAPEAVALDGAIPGVARIVLDGTSVLLHSPETRRLQLISGLPAQPEYAEAVEAPPGEVTAMAVSSRGSRFAVGTAEAVYWYDGGGQHLLAQAHDVSAMAFRAGGVDLVYASRADNEIILVRGLDGSGGISVLAGQGDGIDIPVGIASVNGDRELWIANAGTGSALVIDEAAPGSPHLVPLAATPTRCEAFDGKSLLVFNQAGSGPVLLADWARNRTAYFVPAEAEVVE